LPCTCISLNKIESLGLSLADQAWSEASLNGGPPNREWSRIDLREITHTYTQNEDHGFTLGPLSLLLTPGEIVFIVGGNGSGKSTLIKLLTGLYQPETGQIYLDGELIDASNRDRYRQLFSAIFADFYLFERLYGLPHSDLDRQAQTYLSELELDKKVTVANGTLSTTQLSQGQRKRLALLTAYLENRPIYVFDEWAADQDPVFKQVFYQQLLPNLKRRGKTVLVIGHDDRYFEVGDRLIQLDYGQIRVGV
jgi:putative ATP-binding cassette transporter